MDCFLEWHGDFLIDASGDLMTVDGDDEVRQALERRLFTAVQDYVWHPEYGAGLPQKIGGNFSVEDIRAVVTSQINLEASVAPFPPVQISVAASPNQPDNIGIVIKYWDAKSGISVSFEITS